MLSQDNKLKTSVQSGLIELEEANPSSTTSYSEPIKAEQLLRAIFNSTSDAILVTDDYGYYLTINPAASLILGLPPEKIIGKSVADLFFPMDRNNFHRNWQKFLNQEIQKGEIEYQHPDGKVRVFEFSCNSHTLPGKHISILRDITERKQTEQQQAEIKALFAATFHQAAVGLAHVDPKNYRFLKVNQKFCDIVGYTESEVLTLTFPEITHPDDLETDLALTTQLFAGQIPTFSIEKRFINKNGTIKWANLTCSVIRNADNSPKVGIGAIEDITRRKEIEFDLKRTEARFQRVIQSSVIGIILGNLVTQHITDVNDAFLNKVGYSRDDFLTGKIRWEDITPPEYRHLDEQSIRNLLEKGSTEPFEKQYITKSGERIDVLVSGTLLDETRDNVIIFVVNISDRKQAEELLRKNEERYRLVVEGTNDGVWDLNLQTGEVYWSDRYFEILGLPKNTSILTGEEWMTLVHPEDRDAVCAMHDKHLSAHVHYEYEFRIRHSSGNYLYCVARGELIRDDLGNPIRMVGLLTDITQRKQAEIALQKTLEQERLIRSIVEVVSRSLEGTITWETVAKELALFFKADRCTINNFIRHGDELIPQLIGQYCSESDIPKMDQENSPLRAIKALNRNTPGFGHSHIINLPTVNITLEEARHILEQFQIYPANYSDTFDLEGLLELSRKYQEKYQNKSVLAIEIFYRGVSYGSINLYQCRTYRTWTEEEASILEAIAPHVGAALYQTELYRQEQAARNNLQIYTDKLEQSNRELESFATITSHDLQAPLRKVQLFADHLKTISIDNLSREALDDINRMQRATAKMQHLITDLLNLSRVTRKGAPFSKIQITHIIQEAIADLQHRIQETQGTVDIIGDVELEADPSQFQQLFQNLIENALKYHRPDIPPIIKIIVEQLNNQHCRISVKDNGLGFNEKYLDRIFQVFQRLHGETSEYDGTGIGLAICQKIVERHNGTITANSTEGQGSIFVVTVPLQQPIPT
jgi:PAS domain S-box-containing protein